MKPFDIWLIALVFLGPSPAQAASPIAFDITVLVIDANEGCDVGDIDRDGLLDVVAGRNWFSNGDWTPRPLRVIEDKGGYVRSNGDFLIDVNRDGWLDVIAGDFFSPTISWYENPGGKSRGEALAHGKLWKKRTLAETGCNSNEFSMVRDLDEDGQPEWITNSWTPEDRLVVWRLKKSNKRGRPGKLEPFTLNESLDGVGQGHGMGFGDLNNDGLEDVLVGTGWYERPAGDPWSQEWRFHPDWDLKLCCPVVVRDVNDDGFSDVIWGAPHDFGLYLWLGCGEAEGGRLAFEEQLVDDACSQLHAVHLADIDGDGDEELITGKRVRAHNGKDPGSKEAPQLVYYEMGPTASQFERFPIGRGRVGIGLQIRTADLNADGKLDIVVAGKDGTQILMQR